jgi:8-oxo-dGTP pyrophosphatase MutT (NUDIX family)
MDSTEEHRIATDTIEFAAGGLVWKVEGSKRRLAIVHRTKHNDWSLPKGRPQADEALDDTALREAMEETGLRARLADLAGTYSYMKADRLKVVLMWHITNQAERYSTPASHSEIDRVAWVTPKKAVKLLTHEAEREFVKSRCQVVMKESLWSRIFPDPRKGRLEAALRKEEERVAGYINQPRANKNAWWIGSVLQSLDLAGTALDKGDIDGGWRALHEAQRFAVFGLSNPELVARAQSLRAETREKLKGWRYKATESLWNLPKLNEWQKGGASLTDTDRAQLEQAIVESLEVLNEHSDNLYHRMYLVGRQLNYLVTVSFALLLLTGIGSWLLGYAQTPYDWLHLGGIAVAGAFGAVASAMYQLSRVGEAKIPEALLYGLVTVGRPLVGAISALFLYAVIQSGVISLFKPSDTPFGIGLVLGFAAGFSEQLVLSTVAKVSGKAKDEKPGSGKGNRTPKSDGKDEIDGVDSLDNS